MEGNDLHGIYWNVNDTFGIFWIWTIIVLVAFYLMKDYKFNNQLVETLKSINDKLEERKN